MVASRGFHLAENLDREIPASGVADPRFVRLVSNMAVSVSCPCRNALRRDLNVLKLKFKQRECLLLAAHRKIWL
jgi:hypothetical protein